MGKIVSIAVIVIVAFSVCCSFAVENFLPEAEPIRCPDERAVSSVMVEKRGGKSAAADEEVGKALLSCISTAKPTRKQSVNDAPAASDYYLVKVYTDTEKYHYFVYNKNSNIYIEMPYEGIYKADSNILETIKNICG